MSIGKNRLDLHRLLQSLLGSENVYFQSPGNIYMKYPAILYSLSDIATEHADNRPYHHEKAYSITLIDTNPDNETIDKIAMLPSCSFDRFYVSDNLNHYVFNLFF